MTNETLTQTELDEIIGKLERALERGEIEEASDGKEKWSVPSYYQMMIGKTASNFKYRIRRKPIAGWVNVYPDGSLSEPHPSEEEADGNHAPQRIACVYVEETEAPGDA